MEKRKGVGQVKRKIAMIGAVVAAVLLVLAVILWLTADKTNTVGICYRESASVETAVYRQQLKDSLTAQGFEVIEVNAHADQSKQLAQIAELAKKKCDVLLIEPVMSDAAEELLAAIGQAELPAVVFNRQIDTALLTQYPQVAYIGTEESQTGQLQVQLMEKLPAFGDLNGDGTVSYLLIQGPEDHVDGKARTVSFETKLQQSRLKSIQLAKESGDWTQESGRRICSQQLAAFGKDIEVIVCGNDQMAIGAAQAIADGGRTVGTDVYLLSIGGAEETLQMIQEGKLSGTVYLDSSVQIQAITETVLAKFREEPTEAVKILPYTKVSTE